MAPAERARIWPGVLIAWALVSAVLLTVTWGAIGRLQFSDPDDALRLVQVRDWLGGQGWFDLFQYRMAPPAGFEMHWSRLVDVPIAAVIVLAEPLFGAAFAERLALVVVPLATLLIVIALTASLVRRLVDAEHARLGAVMLVLAVPVLYQLRPLRIDHHGWQIAMALLATLAIFWRDQRRSGLVAGLALAAGLAISIEGLPFTAAVLGVLALRWVLDPGARVRLQAASASLAVGATMLFAATRDPARWFIETCDAVSPAYLVLLAVAAIAILIATSLPLARPWQKMLALGIGAAAAAAAMIAIAPGCAHGPFAALPPIVRRYWYANVAEGLPIWRQSAYQICLTMALPTIGLAGSILAWRRSSGQPRADWLTMLLLLAAATAVAAMVQRAGGLANALAVPGAVLLMHGALSRARAVPNASLRIIATAAALAIGAPCAVIVLVSAYVIRPEPEKTAAAGSAECDSAHEVDALSELPPSTILAPLDVTPEILVATRHRAIASGHHRNAAGMQDVIEAFTGSPAAAERIVARRRVDYVALCPGLNEVEFYRAAAPDGLWSRLRRGERFAWLRPVRLARSRVLVWRVAGSARPPLPWTRDRR